MSTISAGSGSRLVIASFVLLGLAACQTSPPVVNTPPPAQPVADSTAIPAGAHEYKIVAEESLLQILVYRGGAMARLGHNHVIASHHLSGSVFLTDDLAQSRFNIEFPVEELTVDEPVMREKAGADFPPGVPQSARDGTRKNMLSEALLDGANYPSVRLRATEVVAAGENFEVDVEISLKDQVHHVRVPMQVGRKDGVISASGEFPLRQSELGLKPFSAAMGALLVVDEMRVRFEVIAGG
ncbi:MAG: YceI family protein [Pseudomonadota bacterium]